MPELVGMEEALGRILERVVELNSAGVEAQQVPLRDAVGRVLSEPLVSCIDVPFEDNSAMDGIVLNASDFTGGERIEIAQTVRAGDKISDLPSKSVARIFTGAPIPEGGDTVIPQENCEFDGNQVRLPDHFTQGSHIRPGGQDIQRGQTLFSKGRKLRLQDIGLIASQGIESLPCYRKLKVALLSTGEELLEPGQAMESGKVFNSNRFLLQGLVNNLGYEVSFSCIVGDKLEAIQEQLSELSQEADCIISTGGASVGDSDLIKPALESLGDMHLWRLAIKPGKPVLFGEINRKAFFGLPGNPVAVFVTFLFLVKHALARLQGQQGQLSEQSFKVKAGFSQSPNKSRQEFLRVNLQGSGPEALLLPYENQSSGVLSSVSFSEGLALVPVGQAIEHGDYLDYYPFYGLL